MKMKIRVKADSSLRQRAPDRQENGGQTSATEGRGRWERRVLIDGQRSTGGKMMALLLSPALAQESMFHERERRGRGWGRRRGKGEGEGEGAQKGAERERVTEAERGGGSRAGAETETEKEREREKGRRRERGREREYLLKGAREQERETEAEADRRWRDGVRRLAGTGRDQRGKIEMEGDEERGREEGR